MPLFRSGLGYSKNHLCGKINAHKTIHGVCVVLRSVNHCLLPKSSSVLGVRSSLPKLPDLTTVATSYVAKKSLKVHSGTEKTSNGNTPSMTTRKSYVPKPGKSGLYIPEPDSPDYPEWAASFSATVRSVAEVLRNNAKGNPPP